MDAYHAGQSICRSSEAPASNELGEVNSAYDEC